MNPTKPFFRLLISFLAIATMQFGCNGDDDGGPVAQTWYLPEGAALSASQVTSFEDGELYYNVHSAANPGGEARGQISPSATSFTTDTGNPVAGGNFSTLLSGAQEVPATNSTATGYSTIVLDPGSNRLTGVVVTSGIAGSAAHIHDALPDHTGPIVVTLSGGPVIWTVPDATTLTDAQIARLNAGAYYVNVHSTNFPDGEIRGQLDRQVRFARLTGANEVPPVATAGSATAVLSLTPGTNRISGYIRTSAIDGTAAHIHEGAAGVNGPIIVTLAETAAGSGVWVVPEGQLLTNGQADSFNTGDLYYNVHTDANPTGEIRAQIVPAQVKTGTATLQGSQEVPPVTTTASGTGIISLNSVTRGVSGSMRTTAVTGTAAHVHEGAAGSNGPVIIPLTLTAPDSTP